MDRGYRGGGRGGGGGGGRGGGRGGGGGGGGGGGRGGYGGGGGGGGGGRGGYGGGGRGGYGGGDGGSRGGRGGGRGGGGFSSGRRAPPSETWNPPNPVSQQKVAPLAKAPANLSFPKPGDVIPMQQPRAPGTLNFAKIQCLTNYYELKLGQKYSAAYFYTVKIAKIEKKKPEGKKGSSQPTGSRGPRKERKLGMKLNRKVFKEIPRRACGDQLLAYDGRSRACGMKRIPNDCLDLIVKFDGDDWQVDLSYEKSVPLATLRMGSDFGRGNDEEESLLALALMMNHMPSISFTPLGRGFYGLPGEDPKQIGGGFDLWTGYKAHVIPGAQKLYFNVNYAITAFIRPGKLIELLPELTNVDMNATTLHPRNIKDLKMKLSRCRCETLHMENRQKKFTITSVTNLEASKIMFTDRDGARVSVAQYFKIKYKALRYPNWPCVQVGTENPKYLPLEVVKILEGNPFRGEQTPQLVSDIIKCAAIPPRNRLEEIRATVGMLRKQNELDREFDLQIGEELVVPARILPPPRLVCAQNKAVAVRNPGVIDFRADRFYRGSSIKKWTVIITDERCQQNGVNIFVDVFIKQGAASGVQLAPPMRIAGNQFHVISDRTDIDKAEEAIQNFVGRNGLEFVLFVIADSSPIHAAIKFVCDVKLGVSSKCVKSGTINKVVNNSRPGPDQCILNILYGLNPKFDGENVVGINTEFAHNMLMTTPTLILGFDVNHGQAKVRDGLAKMPSTVGVVGTRNFNGTLYNAYMRAQRKPATSADREVIQDEILKPALKKIIIGFYEVTKRKPERIIVYRDGVSNGQFGAVLQKELRAIVEVCQSLPGQYRPPITFVTVQKRHDSRLFPKQVTLDRNGREKQNPIAGTVVDEVMTGSKVWNFYIVAHEGIQGTSKPAHCNVLYDENNFSNDQLQSLTYYMCHLYGKCPRAVSLPSPVYYAHHVAFRGAELGAFRYFKSQAGADATSYSSGSNGNRQLEEEELKIMQIYNAAAEVKHEYAGSMYFL